MENLKLKYIVQPKNIYTAKVERLEEKAEKNDDHHRTENERNARVAEKMPAFSSRFKMKGKKKVKHFCYTISCVTLSLSLSLD